MCSWIPRLGCSGSPFPPKHGFWLNLVEDFFSKFARSVAQGAHHGRHRRCQSISRRPHLVLQARQVHLIRIRTKKTLTSAGAANTEGSASRNRKWCSSSIRPCARGPRAQDGLDWTLQACSGTVGEPRRAAPSATRRICAPRPVRDRSRWSNEYGGHQFAKSSRLECHRGKGCVALSAPRPLCGDLGSFLLGLAGSRTGLGPWLRPRRADHPTARRSRFRRDGHRFRREDDRQRAREAASGVHDGNRLHICLRSGKLFAALPEARRVHPDGKADRS